MAGPRQPPDRRDTPSAADELRRQAEARLGGLSAAASPVSEDVAAVVHDLRVHQIELEMQNEELRRAQLDLQASREKYFELFDLAPVGYLTLTDKGVVGNANFAAAHLLGMERRQLIARPFSAFIFAPDRSVYYAFQRKLEQTGESQTCRLRLRRAGGEAPAAAEAGADTEASRFWAHLESRPRPAADGEPPSTWVTFTDVQDRVVKEEELAHLNDDFATRAVALEAANATITLIAATDHLTGLANRRRFLESLGKAVSLARRHDSPLALVSFDLDGLKRVNDSSGHAAGDGVLTSFAKLLDSLCRAEDLPARLGGDEFSVLLPGIDLSGARGLADRVLAAVCSCAALERRGVTVSGGLAAWTPNETPGDLLRRADHALYAAKSGGGGAVTGDE